MANFCMKCGTPLDLTTGLCPACTPQPAAMPTMDSAPEPAAPSPDTPPVMPAWPEPDPVAPPMPPQPPVPPMPADNSPVPVPPEEEGPKSSPWKTVATVALTVGLCITLLLSALVFMVRQTTSEDGLEDVLEDIRLAGVIDDALTDGFGFGEVKSLDDVRTLLWDKWEIDLTSRQLKKILESDPLKDFLAEKVAAYCDDLYSGEDEWELTETEVVSVLKRSARKADVTISSEQLELIADWIVNEDDLDTIRVGYLQENYGGVVLAVQIVFSYWTLAALLVLSALFVFLLARNGRFHFLCGSGIALIVVGSLLGALIVAVAVLESLFSQAMLHAFAQEIVLQFVGMSIGAIVVGVLLVLIRSWIRRRQRRRAATPVYYY